MSREMIDLSYSQARTIMPIQTSSIKIVVVGLGGTGSFLARHVACLTLLLKNAGKNVTLLFIDPDIVEEANIPRQNFCTAELGRYKAETLATRYTQTFGVEIGVIAERFSVEMIAAEWSALTIVIGAVDNAAARLSIGKVLQKNADFASQSPFPRVWYLDLGNGLDYGQCLLGSTDTVNGLAAAFSLSALPHCALLPSPLIQQPSLKEPQPEERPGQAFSCAQLLSINAQAMTINPALADEAADYLYRFLITGDLKKFATFIDLPTGTRLSYYAVPEMLAQVIGRDPGFFIQTPSNISSHS